MEKDLGVISVGPWGTSNNIGEEWSYNAKYGVEQIIIRHGAIIDSIKFKGHSNHNASADDNSPKFGGDGGNQTIKVIIDFPSEYLTGIRGTFGPRLGGNIHSLSFQTNQNEYGPFGTESGDPFSFNPKGGVITGFHGRVGQYLDSIGVYVKPVSSIHINAPMKTSTVMDVGGLSRLLPRSPGPWGSIKSGRVWDDGVFTAVKDVGVWKKMGVNVISGVRFNYKKRDATTIWSSMHGDMSHMTTIKIDVESEFLIGIEGFYGLLKGNHVDVEVITSLTFHTNKGKHGPFGEEIGTYFTSINSVASKGKVVGFHGASGAYLNAIGVHIEYDN